MERDQASKFVNDLLRLMVSRNGSDLFLTADFPPAIRNLIRENKIAQMYSAIQTGRQIGMQTLDQNLQELVQRNIVSSAEARGKAANKDNFAG
jgi:Tfp pilus assembly pilus retraction ATPase PilT